MVQQNSEEATKPPPPPDIFRSRLLRYLAYSPEFGNALATFSPCGYGKFWCYFPKITHTYILLDTATKGHAAYLESQNKGGSAKTKGKSNDTDKKKPSAVFVALDRYCWHMGASILLPKYTLHMLRKGLVMFSNYARLCQEPLRTYFVTAIVLASIPVIIQPIDAISDHIMDNSFRTAYGTKMSEDATTS